MGPFNTFYCNKLLPQIGPVIVDRQSVTHITGNYPELDIFFFFFFLWRKHMHLLERGPRLNPGALRVPLCRKKRGERRKRREKAEKRFKVTGRHLEAT